MSFLKLFPKDHIKLNKKKDQSVDASILLRKGTKIIMEGSASEGPGWERRGGSLVCCPLIGSANT